MNVNECMIDGYNLIHKSRMCSKKGGGVAILLDKTLQYKSRDDISIFYENYFESCFIELTDKSCNYILGEIYRVPNTPIKDFINKYKTILEKIAPEKRPQLLVQIKTWII